MFLCILTVAGLHSIISAVKRKAVVSTESGGLARSWPPAFWCGSIANRIKPDSAVAGILWGVGTFGQFIMQITWLYMYTFESFGAVIFMLWFFDSQRGLSPPAPPRGGGGGGGGGGGDFFFIRWGYIWIFQKCQLFEDWFITFWFISPIRFNPTIYGLNLGVTGIFDPP